MIEIRDLTKTFDPVDGPVLDRISFSLAAGSTLSIIGPSGCGKTTLLYVLAGLTPASSGSVRIDSGRPEPRPGRTSVVLQDFGLFPWKTLGENVSLGLKLQRVPRAARRKAAARLIEELDLAGLEHRYPVQLSGGQKQRVAIARALATEPDLLLMDEPFSSLDALTREHLQSLLLDLWLRRRLTYAIVTHSVEEAVFLGRRILVLSHRPTRVKALIDNDGFGSPGFRMENAYFEKVRQIRKAMEG